MGFRMKTTLNIDDTVMTELKREAARQGRTMSELVETALRVLLTSQRKRGRIPALPKFRSGGALVDVADRDNLDRICAQSGRRRSLAALMKGARGAVDSGIPDLASNPKHLTGFGHDARRHR